MARKRGLEGAMSVFETMVIILLASIFIVLMLIFALGD